MKWAGVWGGQLHLEVMAINLDPDKGIEILEKAWKRIDSAPVPPPLMKQLIEAVLNAPDLTFKYILVTGYLAKCMNPKIHARVLQVGSKLSEPYDARSLGHKAVVSFEKTKGDLFGLSNEPFVNKPARHLEHDGANTQLRSRGGALNLHRALEEAQSADPADIAHGLVHILRIGKLHAASRQHVVATTKASLPSSLLFVQRFLQEADGGARLVAVWAALTELLSSDFEIKAGSPNASDLYSKTVGDVEVFHQNILISASECKQRALNLDDVRHGITKAIAGGVSEYSFVFSAGLQAGQDLAIRAEVLKNSTALDVNLINFWEVIPILLATLNPSRRAELGSKVVAALEVMRKSASADQAALLWNECQAAPSLG